MRRRPAVPQIPHLPSFARTKPPIQSLFLWDDQFFWTCRWGGSFTLSSHPDCGLADEVVQQAARLPGLSRSLEEGGGRVSSIVSQSSRVYQGRARCESVSETGVSERWGCRCDLGATCPLKAELPFLPPSQTLQSALPHAGVWTPRSARVHTCIHLVHWWVLGMCSHFVSGVAVGELYTILGDPLHRQQKSPKCSWLIKEDPDAGKD